MTNTGKLPDLGLNLYTCRDFLKKTEDMPVTLKKIKDIGYNSVQMSAIPRTLFGFFADACKDTGLAVTSTHIGFDSLRYNMGEIIDLHGKLGCIDVGIGSMPDEARMTADGVRIFAREMSEAGRMLSGKGLRLMYHNHAFEFQKFADGSMAMEILLNETDPQYVDFEIDTCWVRAGGQDPVEWIRKVAGRMRIIHLKDHVTLPDGKSTMCEVGSGELDWKSITEASVATGVMIAYVEQDTCKESPFISADMSFRFLSELGYVSRLAGAK